MSSNGHGHGSPEVVPERGVCCVIEEGGRCPSRAINATFNKKLLKAILQRRQRLYVDPEVSGYRDVSQRVLGVL